MADVFHIHKNEFRQKLSSIILKDRKKRRLRGLFLVAIVISAVLLFEASYFLDHIRSNSEKHLAISTKAPDNRRLQLFDEMPKIDRDFLIADMMILFPEIFSTQYGTKYERARDWLLKEKGIQHYDLRSPFSSGGRRQVIADDRDFGVMPRVFVNLQRFSGKVFTRIAGMDSTLLEKHWNTKPVPNDYVSRARMWSALVDKNSENTLAGYPFKASDLINSLLVEYQTTATPSKRAGR